MKKMDGCNTLVRGNMCHSNPALAPDDYLSPAGSSPTSSTILPNKVPLAADPREDREDLTRAGHM